MDGLIKWLDYSENAGHSDLVPPFPMMLFLILADFAYTIPTCKQTKPNSNNAKENT